MVAIMTVLVVMVFLFNAIFMLYARSVAHHAAYLGARSAARPGGSEASCESVVGATFESLASMYADDTSVRCIRGSTVTSATVRADLGPVFGDLGPRWRFTIRGSAVTEPFS